MGALFVRPSPIVVALTADAGPHDDGDTGALAPGALLEVGYPSRLLLLAVRADQDLLSADDPARPRSAGAGSGVRLDSVTAITRHDLSAFP